MDRCDMRKRCKDEARITVTDAVNLVVSFHDERVEA